MAFHEYEYDLYIILAKGGKDPLWAWSKWAEAEKIIEPLIISKRGNLGMRVSQPDINVMGKAKPVKFGRLVWKEDSFKKWTHGSPLNSESSKNWLFQGVSLWSPIWTICEKEKRAPDFYFDVFNEEAGDYTHRDSLSFNTTVVIAVDRSLNIDFLREVRRKVIELGKFVSADLAAHRIRYWGVPPPWGGTGFIDAINDMAITKHGLLNPNTQWKTQKPSIDVLAEKEKWELLF